MFFQNSSSTPHDYHAKDDGKDRFRKAGDYECVYIRTDKAISEFYRRKRLNRTKHWVEAREQIAIGAYFLESWLDRKNTQSSRNGDRDDERKKQYRCRFLVRGGFAVD